MVVGGVGTIGLLGLGGTGPLSNLVEEGPVPSATLDQKLRLSGLAENRISQFLSTIACLQTF